MLVTRGGSDAVTTASIAASQPSVPLHLTLYLVSRPRKLHNLGSLALVIETLPRLVLVLAVWADLSYGIYAVYDGSDGAYRLYLELGLDLDFNRHEHWKGAREKERGIWKLS